ncbi:hypothetical protein GQ43DRAFT_481069 [Delitschia confertaspora ATCC 74209]|uniref:Uncharacterized protein n=1 Tax=Delitschia confertaspora ATCC 74209 TaxID=1513339 RepID=A0A9P4MVC7_9PLEO|nr:hypothetical protein GQ43DRAFT_481069 [Delitschia confertaspora ATCC 74209]
MPSRAVLATALTVTILGSLFYLSSSSTSTFSPERLAHNMASREYDASLPLSFTLSQISKSSPPSLLITLKNSSPDKTYTILKWDTPLDPAALHSGIFRITNQATNKELDIPRLMLNRKLPPSKEDLEEIAPGTEHSVEVVLDKPWMPTEAAKYKVWVKGTFKGVREGSLAEVQDEVLEKAGGEGWQTGIFNSGSLVLEVE